MLSMAFATIKGGVGKTTLAVHVAAALADAGRKVLFIDLDPQAHGSLVLGLEPGDHPCVADAFGPKPKSAMDQVVVSSPKRQNLVIAPSAPRMFGMERDLFQWGHRLQAIPRALKTLTWEPEVVIIDTPPARGAYTEAALHAADLVVAPVPTGAFALQGLNDVEAACREIREDSGMLAVVVNLWDRRTQATNAAMEETLQSLTMPVARNRIPRAEALNQAGLGYEVIFDASPNAPIVEDLRGLAKELEEMAVKVSKKR